VYTGRTFDFMLALPTCRMTTPWNTCFSSDVQGLYHCPLYSGNRSTGAACGYVVESPHSAVGGVFSIPERAPRSLPDC